MTPAGPVGGNALDLALCDANGAAELLPAPNGPRALRAAGAAALRPRASARDGPRAPPAGASDAGYQGRTGGRSRTLCSDVPAESRRVLQRLFDDGARVVAVATRAGPRPRRAERRRRARPEPGGLPDLRRSPQGGRRAPRSPSSSGSASTVKVITGDNGAVAAKVCRDIGIARRARAHRRRDRAARRRRAAGGDPAHHGLRPRQPRAEVADHQGRPPRRASTSRSSATASTMPSRCTPRTSGSRSSPPPTSPRTPPTSSCSTRTSACSPTASSRDAGSSPTP